MNTSTAQSFSQSLPQSFPSSAYFMWRLFRYRTWPQVVSGLCWVFFHSWPLFPGLLAKAFFDHLAGSSTAGLNATQIAGLIVFLAVIRVGFVYLDSWVGSVNGLYLRGLIQRNLLARILARPGAQALPSTVGDAISTLRDDVATMWGAGWAFDVIGFAIFAVGGLAILFSVDAGLTLFVFLPIVTVIVIAHHVRSRLQEVRTQSREATANVTGAIGEIFGAVQAIQVAGAEDAVIAHLRRLGEQRQQAALRDRLLGLILNAVFENTANLGAGLTLLLAGSAMRSGQFSVGDFALFATYLMQVAGMTGFLGWIVATYQQMGVAFRRAAALLQGAPPQSLVEHHALELQTVAPEPTAVTAITTVEPLQTLRVENLTLRFPESGRGIHNVSFQLARGSLTVIAGRIGAGKTTLLRTLLGLLTPDAGALYWNGQRIVDPAHFLLPPRVAYTPQTPLLLSGTLRENILLGWPASDSALERALYNAVLDTDLATFPDGVDTVIGARGMRLSGGQIQRTAAARMFLRDAELLICDDLSSALDVATEQLLWRRVLALGKTCLIVSHRPALLEQADQILWLEDGQVKVIQQRGDAMIAALDLRVKERA